MSSTKSAKSFTPESFLLAPKLYEKNHLELVKNTHDQELSILDTFQGHSLFEQNRAALMSRTDSKHLLPISKLHDFLSALTEDYSILNAFGKRIFNYQTTYFDDEKRRFYHEHHNGKLNRHKVRFRRYVESDNGFLEIKFKNNKKRTIKNRIPMDTNFPDHSAINDFVTQALGRHNPLTPSLFVSYKRITLMNKVQQERVTIDLDLSFRNPTSQNQSIQDKSFIIEIKQDGKLPPTPVKLFLKQNKIDEVNFSKYCIGLAITDEKALHLSIKQNRFKPVIRQLGKLNARH